MGDFEAKRQFCGVALWDTTLNIKGLLPWPLSAFDEIISKVDTGLGTLFGGEFVWGGRLLKSNGGAQWYA